MYRNGTKVVIVRKVDNFNKRGKMDKWIGKVMTIREPYRGIYKMEEDIEEWSKGWNWSSECFKTVTSLCRNSNISAEEFLKRYYNDLKKDKKTKVNVELFQTGGL